MSRRKAEWSTCEDCGASVFRRRKYGQPMRCYECVAARIESAALEMRAKSGPAWDAWQASNAAGAPGRTPSPKE